MMSYPVIADITPKGVDLKKGEEYYFCRCGLSKNQPFCDGSHSVTDITPKAFTAEKDGKAFLCMCKQSGDIPFCDGTHKNFSTDDIGKKKQ